MPERETSVGALARQLCARMDQLGLSTRQLAKSLDITYEHARRILKGEGIPSKYVLREIATVLEMDLRDLECAANIDRVRKRFGNVPAISINAELLPIQEAWSDLTAEQRTDLIDLAQKWARRNRAQRIEPTSDSEVF